VDRSRLIHGGMGMGDQLEVGRCFKRLTAINVQFGTPDHHLSLIYWPLKGRAEPIFRRTA